jgi:SP family sugar:H+ symporter-like MFS transporter
MNSFASIGKFIGCFVVGDFIERFGHKWSLLATCILNILGAVLEISAKHPAQFVVGRVILYFSVAFCEVTVTTYQAELGE